MSCLPDVNVLFALAIAGHPHNPAAVEWWEGLGPGRALLSLPVRLGVLRLLSNPAIMGSDTLAPGAAWEVWTQLEADERTAALSSLPVAHDMTWLRLVGEQKPTRDLWTDAWLAALSESLPCRMVTFDRGFHRFDLTDLELLGT